MALGAVATLEHARMPSFINRNDRQTTVWVNTEFEPETATREEGRKRIEKALANFELPEGYAWSFSRFDRDDQEALAFMLRGVLLSLAVVLLLMAGLFESLTQPLAILITL
ncbi:MAG: efflux RND transporter permease subunit, partial [Cyanobacteria bacterium J06639_1]